MFDANLQVSLSRLAIAFVPVLLGIILHEVAHGWVASRCGDKTAAMLGRITLNPIPHIDPVGLLMFVITAMSPAGIVFGWAKPVPVNPRNFRRPKRDDILVSAAGAVTNILLAIVFGVLFKLLLTFVPEATLRTSSVAGFLYNSFLVGIQVNFVLAYVNLLPIPPLDGSHILGHLLPRELAWRYASLGRYGFLLLFVLLFTGIVGKIVMPLLDWSIAILFFVLGL